MEKNEILFVGAGPGDPELITVKGMKALKEADLIIYAGSLVPEAVMCWARPETEKVNSASLHLDEIVVMMQNAFTLGKHVVRLHTGDPSLYGAILEQMVELDKHEIPYRVIPGVTAAFAAAASMGLEYTLPEITQTLILTRMAGRTPVPEQENLESLARHQASMAIYLSITLIDQVEDILVRCYGKDALCAVAYRVSQPEEKVYFSKVSDLVSLVKEKGITHQALIIVGKTLAALTEGVRFKSKLYDKDFIHGYRG
ncbi:MAG: precorrin-4 C(11)-methyltransferase [Proteobacteria bacterium]|nr:precorrin-4 C(11)-methyltransferase [Pseudomonadota bacterium]